VPVVTRKMSRGALVMVLLAIYACFEFPAYLVGNMKYLGMFGLSIALMLTIAILCFEDFFRRIAEYHDIHRDLVGKRLLLALVLVLASVSHLNKVLMAHHMYIQARILSLPVNRVTLGVYAAFALTTLAMLIRPPRSLTPIVALAFAWGFVIRVLAITMVPVTYDAADMLFAVNGACQDLLRGVNPYSQTYYASPSDSFPLIYFPLLWLPYLPFRAVGIDIRWLNLLAQAGLLIFFWSFIGRSSRQRYLALIFCLLALLPDAIFSVFFRQLSLYWLLGAVALWLVYRERWNWSALAIASLAAMRLTAFTVLWIYLIYIWKRRGMRTAVAHLLVAAGLLAGSLLPFAGVGAARLKYVFFGRFIELAASSGWQQSLYALSVGGILQWLRLGSLQLPLQALGVFVVGVLYARCGDHSFASFARTSAFAYAWFLWVSGFIAIYYWFFVLIIFCTLCFIEADAGIGSNTPEGTPLSAPVQKSSGVSALGDQCTSYS